MLNCELLYALAEKLNKSSSEKNKIKNILSEVFVFPQLKSTYITQENNISKSLDALLYDLILKTNNEITEHSSNFKDIFIKEYKAKYKDILYTKFVSQDEDEITLLANKVRTTGSAIASWSTDNELKIPGNYLGQTSLINITIKELKPNSTEPTIVNLKNVPFKVNKINKGKNERQIEDWECQISFLDNAIRKYSYDSKSSYSVIIDVELGSTEESFVFFSKKNFIGLDFVQVSDKLLTMSAEQSAFHFPNIKASSWTGKNLALSKEVDNLLTQYILGSAIWLDNNYSEVFKQSFIKEYKPIYYDQIKELLGVSSEQDLLNILSKDKSSSEIYASIEGTTLTLPANLIYTNSSLNLDLIENDIKVLSKRKIPYKKSNKVFEVQWRDKKEEVTEIEIDFDELKKYKFDTKKNYRINLTISSDKKDYSITFIRKQYNSLIILKNYKFVTISQYIYETLNDQILKNNTN